MRTNAIRRILKPYFIYRATNVIASNLFSKKYIVRDFEKNNEITS